MLGDIFNGKILDWEDEGPEFVMEVPRLERGLSELLKLTHEREPRKRPIIVRD